MQRYDQVNLETVAVHYIIYPVENTQKYTKSSCITSAKYLSVVVESLAEF